MTDEPELEFSPLGGRVTRDGTSVQVYIYRVAGSDDGWTLEVADPTGMSTEWNEAFTTDRDAYEAFEAALEAEGMMQFFPEPDSTIH
ncbi:hypothetical protein [Aureimonas leprariae]|uniref:Uncharacterized protein n=1 Tax=Plantimonas leprariae TaxID=2615207 RepID=A0A7V7PME3_9HYPH|nr:hypothetical protein [Aureimonas leprariae]KAB0678080.1 hypothetical protein F6X38_16780 [Aureimonas leprariae]